MTVFKLWLIIFVLMGFGRDFKLTKFNFVSLKEKQTIVFNTAHPIQQVLFQEKDFDFDNQENDHLSFSTESITHTFDFIKLHTFFSDVTSHFAFFLLLGISPRASPWLV